jgi:hypothetical protein
MCSTALKALHGLIHRFVYPEETVKPRKFKVERGIWRYCCETHIPIALDGAFKATEQKVYGVSVHFP